MYALMGGRKNIIQMLGIGDYVLELAESLSVRKIAVRLQNEGYLHKGKPIGKTAIADFIKNAREEGIVSSESSVSAPASDGQLDATTELLALFKSCRRAFNAQLSAIDVAKKNGQSIDLEAWRTLFTSANSLLRQLDLYITKMEGVLGGQALQLKINEYNILIVQCLDTTLEEVLEDESVRRRVRLGFAKTLKHTAKQ